MDLDTWLFICAAGYAESAVDWHIDYSDKIGVGKWRVEPRSVVKSLKKVRAL
jgi:hypothetical protein